MHFSFSQRRQARLRTGARPGPWRGCDPEKAPTAVAFCLERHIITSLSITNKHSAHRFMRLQLQALLFNSRVRIHSRVLMSTFPPEATHTV